MANIKKYTIEINGLKESTSAVDALNRQLDALEQRINKINSTKVSTGGSGSGSSSSRGGSTSSLSEEAKLEKQIAQIDAKRVAYSKEVYQNYLAAKDVLKETVNDQKQIAAQERLQASTYSNTMQGLKQELSDIKTVMQTTDLNSSSFSEFSARADEITEKLKKIEEAYGQFGRNVGNYQSAFDGLGKVTVTLNGITQEFNNLKQAQKALRDGMGVLEVQGKKDTAMYRQMEKELERVSKAQLRLNSAMNDAKASSKAMDDILDTFESIGAIGQITQGFSTLFGIDSSEMEKQIAKLVALQNALRGIEKIRQQMNTQEGIGKIFASASGAIDKFVAKLAGAEVRMGKIIASSKQASIALNGVATALKAVGAVAVTGGLMLVANAIGDLVSKFMKWANAGFEAGDAAKILNGQFDTMSKTFERIRKENVDNYFYKMADESKTLKNDLNSVNTELQTLLGNLGELEKFSKVDMSFGLTGNIKKPLATNYDDAKKQFREQLKLIDEYEKKAENSIIPLRSLFSNIFGETGQMKRNVKDLGEAILQDFLYRVNEASVKAQQEIQKTGNISKNTAETIRELNKEANEDFAVNSVLNNVEKFSNKGEYYASQISKVTEALKELGSYSAVDPMKKAQLEIDAAPDSEDKIKRQNELNKQKEMADVNFNPEYTELIKKKYDRELQENLKAYRKTKKQEADQKKREARDIQNEINELELQLMREGLAKQMKALKNERDEKIQEIIDSGVRVSERSGLTEAVYNKKLLDLKRDWAHEMEKIYEDMFTNIESIEKEAFEREVSNYQQSVENKTRGSQQSAWQGVINPEDPNNLQNRRDYYQKMLEIDLDASRKQEQIRQKNLDKQLEYDKKEEERRHKAVADAKTIEMVMAEMTNIPNPSDADYDAIEKKLQNSLANMKGELVDAYNQGKLDFKDFVNLIEKEQEAHNANMNSLEKQYNAESIKNINDGLEEKKTAYSKYYTELLAGIRTQQDEVSRVMGQQPVRDKAGWGVVNIKQTRQNYNQSEDAYNNIAKDIEVTKQKLKADLKANNITAEDFFMKNQELDAMKKSVDDALKEIEQKQKTLIGDFMQSISGYIQAGMQALQDVMQSIWDAQDNNFDKEQEYLDKLNDELDKKLDEQQDIVQQHKDAINSIEDELATARGDRRQHLIDQLNAEMAAQRAAQQQEKKIQKEKEAAQKKQDALDLKRKKAQYKRDMLQAVVNGAMAVTMAAVNSWPVPAVPMMALAAATTAAQIAIMASNKPYAKGGLLEGKSHAQGGIPIPGTGIEVEGKEYVVRKKSTAPNIDLLEYINKSERKLDLSDFIDFYSGDKPKKAIRSVRNKFEDGGYMPALPNALDVRDQLQNVIVNQDNRPIVVSVVDINSKQEEVRRVQTLAGLEV